MEPKDQPSLDGEASGDSLPSPVMGGAPSYGDSPPRSGSQTPAAPSINGSPLQTSQTAQQPTLSQAPGGASDNLDYSTPARSLSSKEQQKRYADSARQIMAENRDDPYKQVQLLEQLKRDYLKNIYGKDVKMPEAH